MKSNLSFNLSKVNQAKAIKSLFGKVFSKSADQKEGKIVSHLAFKLARSVNGKKIIGITAKIKDKLVACVFLTQLTFKQNYKVFLLAPVAVDSSIQKKGVGKSIINYSIDYLKQNNMDLLMTYGDPSYYKRFSFKNTKVTKIPAPFKLSQPIGWLMLKLSRKKIPNLGKSASCVLPFRKKKLW